MKIAREFVSSQVSNWLGSIPFTRPDPNAVVYDPSVTLYLDAANASSYSGSGNTWYDLSGNGFHATRVGATYTTTAGGGFTFTGGANSTYFDFAVNNLISGTNPFTVEAWVYNGANIGVIIGNYGSGYTTNSLWFFTGGIWINNSNGYIPNYATRVVNGTHHVVSTRDSSGIIKSYLDGNLEVTTAANTASIPTNINWRLGSDVGTIGETFTGNIYVVKIYNRVLTGTEVSSNFSALRGRFGI